MTFPSDASRQAKRTLGHMALNYRVPEEGPLAARLMQRLGFSVVKEFPLPHGGRFYQLVVDDKASNNGDGIIYMAPVPEPERALYAAVHEALGVGTGLEHPGVAALRATQAADPEAGFHVGILYDSLEAIEEAMLTLQDWADNDPDFKGRLTLLCNRSRRGTPAVDERLDASPVFATTPRFTYGRHAVQAFVETDIFASGPLGRSLVLELDYVFPGYPDNIFTATEL